MIIKFKITILNSMILIMIILLILYPIKRSGLVYTAATRLESETKRGKKLFSTIIIVIVIVKESPPLNILRTDSNIPKYCTNPTLHNLVQILHNTIR